jgi:membrane protease YdiL (CAAX protease family)
VNESSIDREDEARFHLAVAGIFALCLAPLVSWGVALQSPKGPWRRWLLVLAGIDTAVFVCLVLLAFEMRGAAAHTAPSPQRARIGVILTAVPPPDGVEVASVLAGSPGERAGLRVGDEITSLDGSPVRQNDRFADGIAGGLPGEERTLHVRRGAAELDVRVVPVVGLKSPPPPLFARQPAPRSGGATEARASFRTAVQQAGGYLAVLLVLAVVALVARRRRISLRPLVGMSAGMIVPAVVMSALAYALDRTVGLSLGAGLLDMIAGGVTMFVVARVSMRRYGPELASVRSPWPTPMPALPAFARGALYLVAGATRAAILALALTRVSGVPSHSAAEVFGVSPEWGPGGIALFAIAAVVVAPFAEESLFRGLLLPWLTTWLSPVSAVLVSALAFGVAHLSYGSGLLVPLVYGLVLGWVRLRTGQLRAGIALHMCINGAVTLLLALRGGG